MWPRTTTAYSYVGINRKKDDLMMYIRLRFSNLAILAVFLAFSYLAYLIWSADDHFPEVEAELHDILSYVLLALELGGRAVVDVAMERNLDIVKKGETKEGKDELLTKADLLSNHLIMSTLQRMPGIHIISEEKKETKELYGVDKYKSMQHLLFTMVNPLARAFPQRKYNISQLTFWVDPLDATQEFIEELYQYVSVMICITLGGEPIFGAIYRPFYGEKVYGLKDYGVITGNGDHYSYLAGNATKFVVISRSHAGSVEKLTSKDALENYTIEAAGGSGYKTLRLLNGSAALYLHVTAIKKWDTCAGDALLRSVDGAVLDLEGARLTYNSDEDFVLRHGLLAAAKFPYTYFQRLKSYLKELNPS